MTEPSGLTPLILVVANQESSSRAIEDVLRPKGQVVLKAHTGQQALDLAEKVSPDAVMVDLPLTDTDGIDLVRTLKSSPTIHDATPILITAQEGLGKAERLEAMAAGAWDCLAHPLDATELILRLDTFVRAKQQADRMRDQGLTDPGTGFYNVRGVLKRAQELSADATRFGRPLTCLAFGNQETEGVSIPAQDLDAMAEPVAQALRSVTRTSDTVGKLGPGEFVVVAPGTTPEGALRLADRVREALEAAGLGDQSPAPGADLLRAGFCTLDSADLATPEDLLLRATLALRRAQADAEGAQPRAFEA